MQVNSVWFKLYVFLYAGELCVVQAVCVFLYAGELCVVQAVCVFLYAGELCVVQAVCVQSHQLRSPVSAPREGNQATQAAFHIYGEVFIVQ